MTFIDHIVIVHFNFFSQYEIEESDVTSRTLWVSVWDWDRFGKNKFLGEVRLPLSSIDFGESSEHWYQLYEKVCEITIHAFIHNIQINSQSSQF